MKKNSRNTFYLLLFLIAILWIGFAFGREAMLFMLGLAISVVAAVLIALILLTIYALIYIVIDNKRGSK